ncbi:hypothetical protein ANN_02917 [Periplaneta americana]|uniref:Uncharacterized protein n=1 Tax=Periplaneta americana TaxID=6978 RepID=A0ABQ8U297_PERAM|nr:hypothetical protein ANN_02917 [Periplaneta americana]
MTEKNGRTMTFDRVLQKRAGVMRGSKTKMTFTVTGASKFSQHSVMQFLAAEGVSPIEMYRLMKKVYVDNCMSRARVYEWTKRYQQG